MTDYIQGIDVSHHNGVIDWARVASDASKPQFVYLKATEGRSMADSQYNSNRAGAKVQGLLCGAYHFFVPSVAVEQQVTNFCQAVGSVKGELPAMLDIESDGLAQPAYAAAVTQWLQQVSAKLGYTPAIYTNASFWRDKLGSFAPFQQYPLWIAHYTGAPQPNLPPGAGGYTFWQYSDEGKVSGIAGAVDVNRFRGTPDQLKMLVCGA